MGIFEYVGGDAQKKEKNFSNIIKIDLEKNA